MFTFCIGILYYALKAWRWILSILIIYWTYKLSKDLCETSKGKLIFAAVAAVIIALIFIIF